MDVPTLAVRRTLSPLALAAVAWSAFSATACGAAAAEPPGGFALLEDTAALYAGIEQYRDSGTVERVDRDGEIRRLTFETRKDGEELEWVVRLGDGSSWRRIWGRPEAAFEYESGLDQFKPAASLVAAVASSLGADGYDALVSVLALAGSGEPFADVEAASLDGEVPCGDGDNRRCRRLLLSRDGGLLQTELWIDRLDGLIRRVVSRRERPVMRARKVPRYDLPDQRPSEVTVVTVYHRPELSEVREKASEPVARLPPSARRVESWGAAPPIEAPEGDGKSAGELDGLRTFSDEITVRLVRFRVRAVDRSGRPLPDLTVDDFEASWGPVAIPVSAVEWVGADDPETLTPLDRAELEALGHEPPPVGRRVVIFVQSAFETIRKTGHRRLLAKAEDLLDTLGEQDRVAVVSFDSHLKLWLDWTRDRSAVIEALRRTTLGFGDRPDLRYSRDPEDLSAHWDVRAAKKTTSPERALELTALAMAEVPGEKLMIYLGWGLGRFSREGVRMTAEYGPAVRALEAARTSVFVLDVTEADAHSLEVGLQSVASATGGAYYRTRHFADQAIRRLATTLSGHYVVTLDGGRLLAAQRENPGERGIDLRLRVPKSEILGPPLALE